MYCVPLSIDRVFRRLQSQWLFNVNLCYQLCVFCKCTLVYRMEQCWTALRRVHSTGLCGSDFVRFRRADIGTRLRRECDRRLKAHRYCERKAAITHAIRLFCTFIPYLQRAYRTVDLVKRHGYPMFAFLA